MKKLALKTYGKILAFVLSLFGLHSCDIVEPRVEYGTPSADYIVKGKITSVDTKKPIKGIRVITPYDMYKDQADTVLTNESGEYEVKKSRVFPYKYGKMKIYAEDPDGESNDGTFNPDSLEVTFTKNDLIKKGSGNWYEGTYQKTEQNISLRNQPIAEYGVRAAEYKEKDTTASEENRKK
ncbi:MAG: radical SAM-associated putative lipoprotein [Paludibacteraceae bacterium]